MSEEGHGGASTERPDGGPWWQTTEQGRVLPLGFVKLDRVGSTREWDRLPEEEVRRRRQRYTSGIEHVARAVNAALPLHFQGDGLMLFVTDGEEPAPVVAYRAARRLWERMTFDLQLPVRIAVHAASVPWEPDTGQLAHPEIDVCGHLEHVAPSGSIAVSERVYLALPERDRRDLAALGVTARDRTPAWVFPAAAVEDRDPEAFTDAGEIGLWTSFRAYAESPEISMLRYVGFRLARREPPSLDIREVFVAPRVRPQAEPGEPRLEELVASDFDSADDLSFAPWARFAALPASAVEPFARTFRRHRSIVLLGDPGSGKTTLLRWLAVSVAGGQDALNRATGVEERLLPLPVSVGRLAEIRRTLGDVASVPRALGRYFHDRNVGDESALETFLGQRLEEGACLVLLDGFDEVAPAEREALRGWLESFASRFPRNRFVVSSRVVGFGGFHLSDAARVVIEPFDDTQTERYVESFCRRYREWETGLDDPRAAREDAHLLLDAFAASPRLRELARNPFLLSALALIHRAEGRLPRHRVQVYEIFARALCETWGAARRLVAAPGTPDIPYEEEALPLLGELALRMHEEWPSGTAPEDFVLDTLAEVLATAKSIKRAEARKAADAFLKRAGREVQLLIERGPGRWGFLHLTFQEFFAAAGLHATERFEEVAFDHLLEPRWLEVLRLGVGYLTLVQKRPKAARQFVERVREYSLEGERSWITSVVRRQVPVAALLAAEAGDALPVELQETIAEEMLEWFLVMPFDVGEPIVVDLASNGFLQDRLSAWAQSEDILRRRVAYRLSGVVGSEEALELLAAAWGRETNIGNQLTAVKALGRIGSYKACEILLSAVEEPRPVARVDRGQMKLIRFVAADALREIRDPAARQLLLQSLKQRLSADSGLTSVLSDRLLKGLGGALFAFGDQEDLDLRRQMSESESASARAGAIIGMGKSGDRMSLPVLRQALRDETADVRLQAALALAAIGEPDSLDDLIAAARDEDPTVRANVVQAIGKFRLDRAFTELESLLDDPEPRIRSSAARALGNQGHVAVGPLVHALSDKDLHVREGATIALGRIGSTEALRPLAEALSDEVVQVRRASAEALGRLRDASAIEPLLEAGRSDPEVRRAARGALYRIAAAVPAA